MASRRLISCCLGVLAAVLLMSGCGSGDSTNAEIDPVIASELSAQLDKIQGYYEDGNCDRASGAVETLREAVEARSGDTGEQFTAEMNEIVDNLESQVDDDCTEQEQSTASSTTTDPVDTEPTDTEPTTASTTTSTTTTTSTSTTDTTTSTPTIPPNGNGNGNGPPTPPGGGISPSDKKGKKDGGKIKEKDEKEKSK